MPAPSSMNLEDAIQEVLARIGQLDDGVSNPLLVNEVVAHLNSAQRQLKTEHKLLAQRRRLLTTVAGGRRFVDLPTDAVLGEVTAAAWIASGQRTILTCGIAPDYRNFTPGEPSWYDISPSTGVVAVEITAGGTGYTSGIATVSGGTRLSDGHDPVIAFTAEAGVITAVEGLDSGSEWSETPTLTPLGGGTDAVLAVTLGPVHLLELSPVPSVAGQLEVEYMAGVTPLVQDADVLSLDPEAVIGKASLLVAVVKNLPTATGLAALHRAYMEGLRTEGAGRVASLSAWRRDAAAPRQARRV